MPVSVLSSSPQKHFRRVYTTAVDALDTVQRDLNRLNIFDLKRLSHEFAQFVPKLPDNQNPFYQAIISLLAIPVTTAVVENKLSDLRIKMNKLVTDSQVMDANFEILNKEMHFILLQIKTITLIAALRKRQHGLGCHEPPKTIEVLLNECFQLYTNLKPDASTQSIATIFDFLLPVEASHFHSIDPKDPQHTTLDPAIYQLTEISTGTPYNTHYSYRQDTWYEISEGTIRSLGTDPDLTELRKQATHEVYLIKDQAKTEYRNLPKKIAPLTTTPYQSKNTADTVVIQVDLSRRLDWHKVLADIYTFELTLYINESQIAYEAELSTEFKNFIYPLLKKYAPGINLHINRPTQRPTQSSELLKVPEKSFFEEISHSDLFFIVLALACVLLGATVLFGFISIPLSSTLVTMAAGLCISSLFFIIKFTLLAPTEEDYETLVLSLMDKAIKKTIETKFPSCFHHIVLSDDLSLDLDQGFIENDGENISKSANLLLNFDFEENQFDSEWQNRALGQAMRRIGVQVLKKDEPLEPIPDEPEEQPLESEIKTLLTPSESLQPAEPCSINQDKQEIGKGLIVDLKHPLAIQQIVYAIHQHDPKMPFFVIIDNDVTNKSMHDCRKKLQEILKSYKNRIHVVFQPIKKTDEGEKLDQAKQMAFYVGYNHINFKRIAAYGLISMGTLTLVAAASVFSFGLFGIATSLALGITLFSGSALLLGLSAGLAKMLSIKNALYRTDVLNSMKETLLTLDTFDLEKGITMNEQEIIGYRENKLFPFQKPWIRFWYNHHDEKHLDIAQGSAERHLGLTPYLRKR